MGITDSDMPKVIFVQKTYSRPGNGGNCENFDLLKSISYVESIARILRSRSGLPNNPLQIKQIPEAEHSLLSMTLCHFVSQASRRDGDR